MTKKINIAGMELNVPDYGSNIGKAVEQISNDYEADKITAIFVVYSTKNGVIHMNTGSNMVLPFVNMAAATYANATLDGIEASLVRSTMDDDDEE